MKLLFEIDKKNYDNDGKAFIRPSARAIIIKDNKIYMVHSLLYDYYKFPGGGIEHDESNIDALIRETKEEAGLMVIKDSIKEYGYVHRKHKSIFLCNDCLKSSINPKKSSPVISVSINKSISLFGVALFLA